MHEWHRNRVTNVTVAAKKSFNSFFPDEVIENLFSNIRGVVERECERQEVLPSSIDSEQSVSLDDEELRKFWEAQKTSTQKKTLSDLRIGIIGAKGYMKSENWEYSTQQIRGVRSASGSQYEPSTLTSILRSLYRHLTKDNHKPYNIITDSEFSSSEQLLIVSKKMLKKEGKGNLSKRISYIRKHWNWSAWISGALGSGNPEVLQNTVWFLLCLHLGMRGLDDHCIVVT